jgi:hypothetical protein
MSMVLGISAFPVLQRQPFIISPNTACRYPDSAIFANVHRNVPQLATKLGHII